MQSLSWCFGFSGSGVHSLSSRKQRILFYTSAHTGVLYDAVSRKQHAMQAHSNSITATCVSADLAHIATADSGPAAMVVVWHLRVAASENTNETRVAVADCTPVRTLTAHDGCGAVCAAFTHDCRLLVTLGAGSEYSNKGSVI